MNKRALVLYGLLVVCGGLVAYDQFAGRPDAEQVVAAAVPAARPANNTPPPVSRNVPGGKPTPTIAPLLPRSAASLPDNDAFAPPIPKVDPAKAAAKAPLPPPPPPPPAAPPLPFAYVGKKLEGGQWTVFLSRQDRSYVVHVNDALDGEYRVVSISPVIMELLYLPLNEKQTLSLGSVFP